MNTKKIIAAAVAVIIASMPVTVQARHTEDTYYNKYSEGQEMGSLTYAENTFPVLFGISQQVVDTGNVELFGLSAQDHLIMLAHSDKAFSRLYENSQVGTKINVVLNGSSEWYEVFNTYWIDQNTWESEENLYNFYYVDNTPLTLVTCNHRNGVRGRWVVQCTYSSAPIENTAIIEDVVYLPVNEEIIETVEEVETFEMIEENEVCEIEETEPEEETPVVNITPLNLLRMKKVYASDYIRLYRGL